MDPINVAVIQMNSTPDKQKNIRDACTFATQAFDEGAHWVVFPEVTNCRGSDRNRCTLDPIPGDSTRPLCAIAKSYKRWIILGVSEKIDHEERAHNTCVVINPQGDIEARYHKLHLFDTDLTNPPIRESAFFKPGQVPVIASIDGIKVGLSICFDVRFPHLYQHYVSQGAHVLVVPSSFTVPSGELHWEVLLRARAIETQCFVIAPNQTGIGACNVPTFGNSMIIDPLGRILARAPQEGTGVTIATLDFSILENIRQKMPLSIHKKQGDWMI